MLKIYPDTLMSLGPMETGMFLLQGVLRHMSDKEILPFLLDCAINYKVPPLLPYSPKVVPDAFEWCSPVAICGRIGEDVAVDSVMQQPSAERRDADTPGLSSCGGSCGHNCAHAGSRRHSQPHNLVHR